ncbi:NAD(P)/FAD-dependent oxidoreductase [Pseudomonas gingeri NCPPB 3146 = LMG 5327]|uniref:NAD(P)/FAD-dependent oxidoreductase n=2 Tax=Pseudomonas gingeri TaxID=117681 RepID=A0A7Y8CBJ4_9PSED|nr:NAD(P)/FAD-dependent oxidoreductase [Pseudomonas gingeri]NWC12688.1 NAD(P)/FAD-dependent oxidoreductase [Pseudomonas gingeri]PNQ92971.1 NAD(P)/FAD-dependent oxidoreductase [Pseudomonas gingeri NCPPB 3146 = LMG 5327]
MKQHILIVGAGFAGVWSALSAARQLDLNGRSDEVRISVLAPQPELRIRPRFYEPDVHEMKASLVALFDATGIHFVEGQADRIDTATRRVEYLGPDGARAGLNYDRLVLATGSQVVRPKLEGVEHAFDVDSIEAACTLEKHLKALGNQPESPARNTVIVCGGGFTGIETATEMPARLRAVLGEHAKVQVIVVDRGNAIGAAFGQGISPSIAQASADLGIEWCLDASVASVDSNGVTLADGRRIEAKTVIWTVGFRANPLTAQIPGERDPLGRLYVDPHLKVLGQDAVYAAGDVAYATTDELGNVAAMSCQHAISLGRHAGNNVAAELIGVPAKPYSQPKYVTCLDLGAWGAVYTEGWDRQLKLVKEEAKQLKTSINTVWIYPPAAERATALASADPLIPVA